VVPFDAKRHHYRSLLATIRKRLASFIARGCRSQEWAKDESLSSG
jgi:hypothetical protein